MPLFGFSFSAISLFALSTLNLIAITFSNLSFWQTNPFGTTLVMSDVDLNNLFTYEHTGKRKYFDTYREYLPDN